MWGVLQQWRYVRRPEMPHRAKYFLEGRRPSPSNSMSVLWKWGVAL